MLKRTVSAIMLTLLLVGILTFLAYGTPLVATWRKVLSKDNVSESLVVINESEYTWYGNFIVNETDTVIVENCSFTVVDGFIYVNGELQVLNSVLQIRKATFEKFIYVQGSFNLCCSSIIGRGEIQISSANFSVYNSTLSSWEISAWGGHCMVSISNSKFRGIFNYQNVFDAQFSFNLSNSEIETAWLNLPSPTDYWTLFTEITNSSINWLKIVPRGNNVEFRNINKGEIENWTYLNERTNMSITNSIVLNELYIRAARSQNFYLSNSNVDLELELGNGIANLTLRPGYFQFENIYTENVANVTISNSTISSWLCFSYGGFVQFVDSVFSLYMSGASNVTVSNSTMPRLITAHNFGGNLIVMDSEVDMLEQRPTKGSMDLAIQPGHQSYLNFYNEQLSSNVTILRTTVGSWSFEAVGSAILNIYNSTLPSLHTTSYRASGLFLYGYSGGQVYLTNSSVDLVIAQYNSCLALVDSTVKVLYAYDNSNITAVNSTIHTLIKDPPIMTFVNTKLFADILLSFQLPDDVLSIGMLENCPTPLQSETKCVSEYLQINSTYNDVVNARIKIYYNETKIEEVGADERNLRMYYLEESLNSWQLCAIQGVNTTENCAWANVTHFSCFVVGIEPISPSAIFTSPAEAYINETVTFNASDAIPGWNGTHSTPIISYTWNFDDGNMTETTNPVITHAYTTSGTYSVTLNVTDSEVRWNATSKSITIQELTRNIAIVSITLAKTIIGQGYCVKVNVTIENQGSSLETVNATLYANATIVTTHENIAIIGENSATVIFTWNTTDFAHAYVISANVTIVEGETYTDDNSLEFGIVKVSCIGDLNGDYVTDGQDFQLVKIAVPSSPGSPRWNPNADLNDDGIVDGQDFQTVKNNIGQSAP